MENQNKLSSTALFDDLSRVSGSLFENFFYEQSHFEKIMKQWEKNRVEWLRKKSVLEDKNKQLNMQIVSLKQRFAQDIINQEHLMKQHKGLKKKFQVIWNLIQEEVQERPSSNQSRLMTALSEFVQEKNPKFINEKNDTESEDELLFDTSDSFDQLNQSRKSNINSREKLEIHPVIDQPKKNIENKFSTIEEEKSNEISSIDSVLNLAFVSDREEDTIFEKPNQLPASKILTANNRRSSQIISRLSMIRTSMKLEPDRLDSRKHKFQEKKAFKSIKCTVCDRSIRFCSSYFICAECHSVVDGRCRNKLPLPCLPTLTKRNQAIKRMISTNKTCNIGFLVIGDFVDEDTRPSVPPFLVYCCNEIKRRIDLALISGSENLSGLYRLSSSNPEVRKLRNKILECKNGIFNLSAVENVQMICGAVKLFFQDLSDSLLTSILWHNFVRAADHVINDLKSKDRIDSGLENDSVENQYNDQLQNPTVDDQAMEILKCTILELPLANRDSLAFFMLHLKTIIRSEQVTHMNAASLTTIFAHLIVGNSQAHIPGNRAYLELPKQLMVMKALFIIDSSFWSGMLYEEDFNPFSKKQRSFFSSINLKELLELDQQQPIKAITEITMKKLQNNNLPTNTNLDANQKLSTTALNTKRRLSIENSLSVLY